METTWNRQHEIATVTMSSTGMPEDLVALENLLGHPEVKAVTIAMDNPSTGWGDDTVERLRTLLMSASVPVAAVCHEDSPESVKRMADACHFIFLNENEAGAFLTGLTERRPVHVIRAVMTSIGNGRRLAMETALLEETRLFCGLCALNRKGPEAPSKL